MLVSDLRYTELITGKNERVAVHDVAPNGTLLVYQDLGTKQYNVFVYVPTSPNEGLTFRGKWNCSSDLELQCVLHEVFAGATDVVD